jgi:hypothetical protein
MGLERLPENPYRDESLMEKARAGLAGLLETPSSLKRTTACGLSSKWAVCV